MLPAAARPAAAAALTTHSLLPHSLPTPSHQLPVRCFRRSAVIVAMARPWRPDMNDVDRLSKGDGAKVRGTGNFNIPHRLNADERPVYEAAKKKGFLQVRGSGYRKGRRGHPLPNVWRQWCDARGRACVVVEQGVSLGSTGSTGTSSGVSDVVVVDLAPLRLTSLSKAVQMCHSIAQAAGAAVIPTSQRPLDAVPFNTLPVDLPVPVLRMLYPEQTSAAATSSSSSSTNFTLAPTPDQIAAAELSVVQQGDVVRQLKAAGNLGNSSPEVQQEVKELLRLKAHLQQLLHRAAQLDDAAEAAAAAAATGLQLESGTSDLDRSDRSSDSEKSPTISNSSSSSLMRGLDEDHPFACAAIWQIPAMPLFYAAERSVAKDLAKQISVALAPAAMMIV